MGTSEGARKSATPEARAKRAEAMRRKWQDPEYVAAWKAARNGTGPRKMDQPDADAERRPGTNRWLPEKRKAFSERMKERAADPDVREKLAAANRERWEKPESRTRASEQQMKRHADPEKHARHLAALQSQKQRDKISSTVKAQWAQLTPEERRQKTAKMRNSFKGGHKLTSIESKVMMALNDLNAWYLVHKQIDGFTADILVQPDLIVECDGAYYHNQRKDTDAIRDQRMTELGYRTLRLGEAEINDGSFTTKLHEALGLA